MKSPVLAVAIGLLVGCSQAIPQDLKAFDTYCVNAHIRYAAWSTRGEIWITAWPDGGDPARLAMLTQDPLRLPSSSGRSDSTAEVSGFATHERVSMSTL